MTDERNATPRDGATGSSLPVSETIPRRLSPIEVEDAINQLVKDRDSMFKIIACAKWQVRKIKSGFFEPKDLVHEAFMRALRGQRAWPAGLPGVIFFAGPKGVIRSIASEWAQNHNVSHSTPTKEASIQASAYVHLEYQDLISLFKDDKIALTMVVGMIEGVEGEELRMETGLTLKDFHTKRRNIRRRINNYRGKDMS